MSVIGECMTLEEELEYLRKCKVDHETTPLKDAFKRLEAVLDNPYSNKCDAVMSVRAFRVLAECLIALKHEVMR